MANRIGQQQQQQQALQGTLAGKSPQRQLLLLMEAALAMHRALMGKLRVQRLAAVLAAPLGLLEHFLDG
jgi:hypothetical protein